ncbi:hypothetical protein THARTR1_02494 [Trichoderma harzianum]|uniref:Glutamine synthetase n=1 Tax=Trichoderma harzianum TaxID=5544 RepID=A0A2K0UIC4_TRIHA|nr:hypothetical protein THARTR1_02494 [Trichoderma harzianum]
MANREILSSRTETLNKYLKLDQKGKIMAEYVWIDSTGETRSKSRLHCAFASSGNMHAKPPTCPVAPPP